MPTGPGGLDSNGIWQFGEDDSEALASDLLNLGMGSVSDAFTNLAGILQVVSTAKTDAFTTTSSTFTTITGLTQSITPTLSTNKVLVIVQLSYAFPPATQNYGFFRLAGGNTSSYRGNANGSNVLAVFGGDSQSNIQGSIMSSSIVFLDSPATTASTTYSVECSTPSNTVFVNRTHFFSTGNTIMRGASSITLMEVAG